MTRVLMPSTPADSSAKELYCRLLCHCQIMGCNTSWVTSAIDPAEEPEERLETDPDTKQAPTEEPNGSTDKGEDENHHSNAS